MAARREFVDDRDLSGEDNDPPNHGRNTHETAQFLEWCAKLDREVSPEDLGDLYQEWRERRDNGEQADLGRFER